MNEQTRRADSVHSALSSKALSEVPLQQAVEEISPRKAIKDNAALDIRCVCVCICVPVGFTAACGNVIRLTVWSLTAW